MIIRQTQIEAFQPQAEEAFQIRLAEYISEEFADRPVQISTNVSNVENLSDETLLTLIQNGLKRGRTYGMTWESSLFAFVSLMFEFAPNFDEHPSIRRSLEDAEVEPDLRINYLLEQTNSADWEAVEKAYDSSAWNVIEENKSGVSTDRKT